MNKSMHCSGIAVDLLVMHIGPDIVRTRAPMVSDVHYVHDGDGGYIVVPAPSQDDIAKIVTISYTRLP